ncbi:transcriptional regulator [Hymenobacter gummosus]|uniref:Transcriptional regulator n=1 Tax=Hymenobacter gummosus TaxID=1776032 RepID=A0A431U8X5_9BACT|nr:helix-turn-helix domain-containing protein [Hymenobacter gummosus]RTQ53671.1 transcriptional regulator [Hymenobacter gummosus]
MDKLTKQQQASQQWQASTTPPPPNAYCPVRTTLNVLGGKWKLLILSYLLHEPRRYGELKRLVPEITEKMLIQELRELELDGIVARRVYQQVPPKVEYYLTDLGQEVKPLFQALVGWGQDYIQRTGVPAPVF